VLRTAFPLPEALTTPAASAAGFPLFFVPTILPGAAFVLSGTVCEGDVWLGDLLLHLSFILIFDML
jgi:hypothetical protein